MQIIPLETIPNQEFSILLDDSRFVIRVFAISSDMMGVTITRDEVLIVNSSRATPGKALMPFEYMEGATGNFAFATFNDDLPWWENFNATQQLIYGTADELEAIRNGV